MKLKRTTEQFIKEAETIYAKNGKGPFDFSKTVYEGVTIKTKIICPIHGEFEVTPHKVLSRGYGCPKCAIESRKKNRRFTTKEFIERAIEVHGNKYDYSKVNYINSTEKVCIICPDHGEFWQTPDHHINKKDGCPKCANENRNKNRKLTTKEFIERSLKTHGNKYDYSKVEYIDNETKVKIICPEHGEFLQAPSKHLVGNGCPKCSGKNKTTKDFIKEAIKVHGNKYDYSKVEYKKCDEKVCIICPEHGEFWQSPTNHLNGRGCFKCKESHGEEQIRLILEENGIKYETQKRFKNCKDKNSLPFDFYLPTKNIAIEYDGQQHFENLNIFGGEKEFERRKLHDSIKNDYCIKNGISLIRINYKQNVYNEMQKII